MAKIASDVSLLIVCRALNPFVTRNLIEVRAGKRRPIQGAATTRIGDMMRELHKQDREFGQRAVNNILQNIFDGYEEDGFVTNLSKAFLVQGKYPTLGALSNVLRRASREV